MRRLLILGLVYPWVASARPSNTSTPGQNVIVQLFEWNWDSVAAECTSFIGPAGYGFVQVSPAQEHVAGDQWWTDYQPVSYTLTSKRGNRTQYKNMIDTCHKAGVKVIADTILNHMSAQTGTGSAGSTFQHYDYPGDYTNSDFHHCGLEPGDEIVNYTSRAEVQTCELDNLADLNTTSEKVRTTLAAYVNDLLSLGVDGLRLDAAKHIAATDIINITSRLTSKPYITQEVIWGQGEAVQPPEYINIGDIQEFRYASALQNAFGTGTIDGLRAMGSQGWIDGSQANVFVANHDTERNNASLRYDALNNGYVNANVFALAHPYGVPTVLSSYTMSDNDVGAPNNGTGTCSGAAGSGGWLCQHRWPAIAGMVGFRNAVGPEPAVINWTSPTPQRIAFSRGNAGFVAINAGHNAWVSAFATGLPAGSYCDVVAGTPANGMCMATSIVVSADGTFNATVPALSSIAIHTAALGSLRQSNEASSSSPSRMVYLGVLIACLLGIL